jgi:competence protein ComEC
VTPTSSPNSTLPDGERERIFTGPVAVIAAAFALGIACGGSPAATETLAVWWTPALFIGAAISLAAGALLLRTRRENLAAPVIFAGFALAGACASLLFAFRFPPNHVSHLEAWGVDLSRPVRLQGRVLSDPVPSPSGLEFDVEATRISQTDADATPFARSVSGKVQIRLSPGAATSDETLNLQPGDAIEAVVHLRRPRVYANPGSFDFRQRAASIEDLFWEGTVSRAHDFRLLSAQPAYSIAGLAEAVRRRVRHSIDRLYPPWSLEGRDGAVLKAILLGDRSSLDSATLDNFRATGLFHLLVIAGLHVGLIATLVLGLLRLLRVRKTPRYAVLLAVLLAYSALVQQRAPTLRATLMLGAFVVAQLLGREYSALNSIGLAALLLLIVRPAWLFETGFQLSFSAALLIFGLAAPALNLTIEPYRRALRHLDVAEHDASLEPRAAQFRLDVRVLIGFLRRRFLVFGQHPRVARGLVAWPLNGALRIVELLVFSAVLQIGLLLPMAETFHRVTLAGVGLNALAVPVMGVLLALAIPTVALATVSPPLAVWPAKALALIFKVLFALAALPHLPAWLSYRVPSPPFFVAAGFVLSLVAAAFTLHRSRIGLRISCAAFAGFALLLAIDPFPPRLPSGTLEITSLDCGGGSATAIVSPERSLVLDGACGEPRRAPRNYAESQRWDPGENIVSPYLWSRNVKTIDALVITGASEGTLDGYRAILRNFRVRRLWYAAEPPVAPIGAGEGALASILDDARQRGVMVQTLSAGSSVEAGGAQLELVGAPPGLAASQFGPRPLLVISSAGRGAALVADGFSLAAATPASRLAASLRSAAPSGAEAVVGPAAALTILQEMQPQIAVITAAEPPALLSDPPSSALLRPRGRALVFDTNRDGAVTIAMRGSSLGVWTFRGVRLSLR